MNGNIIIKFGELFLKGKNKNEFIKALFKNVQKALFSFEVKLVNKHSMFFLKYKIEDESSIIKILKMIPGIHHFFICLETKTNIDNIATIANSFDKKYKTFKIEVKRRYKDFLEQTEIKSKVASYILKNNEIKVDVHNPELTINIEIYDQNISYVWFDKILGIGGLPIGVNGRCLSLLSGGIDSPVASFLLQKRGQQVDYLTFITDDVTNITINKLKSLIKQITLNCSIYKPKFFIVDFTKVQYELMHMSNEKYRITLMRRSFYRIAQQIAKKYKINSLICGDSLGQVASQTIESINVISQVCDQMQIFRPLLTFDKLEIIDIAKQIGTYEISISEHEDVCSMFAPKHPITKPKLNIALQLENELELLKNLEDIVIKNVEIIREW